MLSAADGKEWFLNPFISTWSFVYLGKECGAVWPNFSDTAD
jgi:hypothetical protein